jgi:hypothetical protein
MNNKIVKKKTSGNESYKKGINENRKDKKKKCTKNKLIVQHLAFLLFYPLIVNCFLPLFAWLSSCFDQLLCIINYLLVLTIGPFIVFFFLAPTARVPLCNMCKMKSNNWSFVFLSQMKKNKNTKVEVGKKWKLMPTLDWAF